MVASSAAPGSGICSVSTWGSRRPMTSKSKATLSSFGRLHQTVVQHRIVPLERLSALTYDTVLRAVLGRKADRKNHIVWPRASGVAYALLRQCLTVASFIPR